MSDFDIPFGQAVKQEPSDKLHGADSDWFCAVFLSIFGSTDLGFQFCVYSKKACFYTIGSYFAK